MSTSDERPDQDAADNPSNAEESAPAKAAIKANCADINTEPYRTEPENHTVCPR